MSGIIFENEFKENTDYICRICGNPVWEINEPKYAWKCYTCNNKFEYDDVSEQCPHHHPAVWISFNPYNESIFCLDSNGDKMKFKSQIEAECYLLEKGFSYEDLSEIYFIEQGWDYERCDQTQKL